MIKAIVHLLNADHQAVCHVPVLLGFNTTSDPQAVTCSRCIDRMDLQPS